MTQRRQDESDRPAQRNRSPGPRRRLSRDAVVEAAIDVIQTDGLPALSMRRIAEHLGVVQGTLYTYVSNRTALMVLVLDSVVGWDELPHQLPGSWRQQLERWARTDFADFCARPWVLDLRASVREFGPNMVAWFDSALEVFDGLPVTDEMKLGMIGTLDAYVVGSAFVHLESATDDRPAPDMESAVLAAYEAAPTLQRALADAPRTFGTERFEFGLACLLDGFAAVLEGSSRPRGPR